LECNKGGEPEGLGNAKRFLVVSIAELAQ